MKTDTHQARFRRKRRIRAKIVGTESRPRLSVFRSNKALYVQFIDDGKRQTLIGLNEARIKLSEKVKVKRAYEFGKKVAEAALKLNIKTVVFDRGGYRYHGRVKALAEGLREGGIKV